MVEMQRSIDDILDDLNVPTGLTKLRVFEEAAERRDELVPVLNSYLQQVVDAPRDYYDLRWNHDLLPYALLLLAYFKEESSHGAMLSLFRLPRQNLEVFVGETTAILPFVLLRTCGGSLEGIKDLVTCSNCDDFVRWAAMEALTYAVGSGMADRGEIVSFVEGLLTGEEAEPDSYFWLGVGNTLCDLYPAGVVDKITAAYSRGLIPPRELSMEEIEDVIDLGLDYAMERLKEEANRRLPDDLQGVAAIYEAYSTRSPIDLKLPKDKKKKEQKKSKKKMAKASRRKNR